MSRPTRDPEHARRLVEVAALFTRLGFVAFGGPVAHIALMHDEVVKRRRWLDEQEFLDLLGATNLIPGPNSTEMAIHLGYRRAGWQGLIIAGACFILPAVFIVLLFAWAYVRYGSLPAGRALLYGVTPVIVAVIAQALWQLFRKAGKTLLLLLLGAAAFLLYLLGIGEIPLMFGTGLVYMLIRNARGMGRTASFVPLSLLAGVQSVGLPALSLPGGTTTLFLVFFKVGALLYGSGYVLLAFLQADLVERLGWLSNQQLLDAVAVGQFTPGPVFTTATFVGYLLGSWWGAAVATLAIFLPSFFFIALIQPLIPLLRNSTWFGAMLDGVNVAALALMAAVTLDLAGAAIDGPFTAGLALVSAVLLIRFRVNSVWLIISGAAAGLLRAWLLA